MSTGRSKGDEMGSQRLALISLLLMSFVPVVHANTAYSHDGAQKIKAKSTFEGMLVLTNDLTIVNRWHDTNHNPRMPLRPIHLVHRNKSFQALFIFGNAGYDAKGLSNVTANIRILAPGGSIYWEGKDLDCSKGLSTPLPGELQPCQGQMEIVIEDKDKTGQYTVEATIRDNIRREERSFKQYFDVV